MSDQLKENNIKAKFKLPQPKKPSKKGFLIFLLVVLVILSPFAYQKIVYSLTHQSTDDAYVEGTYIYISPEISGKIVAVNVERYQEVKKGQVLAEIETSDYTNALNLNEATLNKAKATINELESSEKQAEAALQQAMDNYSSAKAQAELAQKEKVRYEDLYKQDAVSADVYDTYVTKEKTAVAAMEAAKKAVAQAKAALDTIRAQKVTALYAIKQAKANLDQALVNVKRTKIYAPEDGYIAKKFAEVGNYAVPGQTLFILVKKNDLWVTANFKETQLDKMRVGQKVDIYVDAYPGIKFEGHVESFQPGTGAVFSLLPPENATGNFVKVVQRVPVRIAIDSPYDPKHPLYPGLSVNPYVDTGF
ncbi:secretion protein HlyD family protein [Thermodesulfobium narugense DSM 14796]|uniref:Secretion protein HlyD family protein n=1 Tax=Thermodesulfobium narugense DSM 14796 TaxID=747365 RepID=M1E7S5_9BACT|nr:HlyD family secretion protein [Thermodesulfobium narugense]AEE15391.1 secretion protein HlyD family protein [Thermodesulfobium narugense DSM 14796]